MDENQKKMISELTTRYLVRTLFELRATITDGKKLSCSQIYNFLAMCRKTIADLEANPPKINEYYSCSLVGKRGPEDFLLSTLAVIDEAIEKDNWGTLSSEEQELLSIALRIVDKCLGLTPYQLIEIVNRSGQQYLISPVLGLEMSNFCVLECIGSNLISLSHFVKNEDFISSPDVLFSVINELETEQRHLISFFKWFLQYSGTSFDSFMWRKAKVFRLLSAEAVVTSSGRLKFARRLRECGSKIYRIAKTLSNTDGESHNIQLDSEGEEIAEILEGYLSGLKGAIEKLTSQLSPHSICTGSSPDRVGRSH